MNFKRTRKLHKKTLNPNARRKFLIAASLQSKFESTGFEVMFIDEFSVNDRGFKYYGWSRRGEKGYFQSLSDSFSMSFFLAFSAQQFYGILGGKGSNNAKRFIHFL